MICIVHLICTHEQTRSEVVTLSLLLSLSVLFEDLLCIGFDNEL